MVDMWNRSGYADGKKKSQKPETPVQDLLTWLV